MELIVTPAPAHRVHRNTIRNIIRSIREHALDTALSSTSNGKFLGLCTGAKPEASILYDIYCIGKSAQPIYRYMYDIYRRAKRPAICAATAPRLVRRPAGGAAGEARQFTAFGFISLQNPATNDARKGVSLEHHSVEISNTNMLWEKFQGSTR